MHRGEHHSHESDPVGEGQNLHDLQCRRFRTQQAQDHRKAGSHKTDGKAGGKGGDKGQQDNQESCGEYPGLRVRSGEARSGRSRRGRGALYVGSVDADYRHNGHHGDDPPG